MSDIQPGDVVVCIRANWRNALTGLPTNVPAPVVHGVYRVDDQAMSPRGDPCLRLRGFAHWWNAAKFRPIRPADPEFAALVKRVTEPAL